VPPAGQKKETGDAQTNQTECAGFRNRAGLRTSDCGRGE
jgi:hypothetical protein